MRHAVKAASVVSVAALTLSACGGSSDAGSGSAAGDGASVKACLAYDMGGRRDQPFTDSATRGLDRAEDELDIETDEFEVSHDESDAAREDRLNQLVESGCTNIIGAGYVYASAIGAAAEENPDVHFAVIDDASEASSGENVAQLVFAEQEGSFLVGAAAALKSKSGTIGFIGGTEAHVIDKFEAGYLAGAEAVDEDIEVRSRYLAQDGAGFDDPAKGETAADRMYEGGADVIFHAAGGSGAGVFEAADAASKMAIGVDSDQASTADKTVQDVIITSMVKNVDLAVFEYLKAATEGEQQSGKIEFGLESGGVSYSTTGGRIDDITDELEQYEQDIIDGKITVPST